MKLKVISSIFLSMCCLILTSCAKKNHPPVILDQVFSVAENTSAGTFVGKVIAMDEDNDTVLTYAIIKGNTNNAFKISGTDGSITINNEEAVDYETTPTFTLLVEVRDRKNSSATSDITINLENIIPSTAGLILYYPFDGNISDASGNSNNGINYTSSNYVSGKWGQGLDRNLVQWSFMYQKAEGIYFLF